MEQVYVSSTYEDLIDCRKAAVSAISRVPKCKPLGMESYVSSSERPVDLCLADVRSSDALVLIVARRYGFRSVHDQSQKSITQLEYEEACRARIPRLVFLLRSSKKTWPHSDKDCSAVNRFRKHLRNEYIVSEFEDADSLGTCVEASLKKMLESGGSLQRFRSCESILRLADVGLERLPYLSWMFDSLRGVSGNTEFGPLDADQIGLSDVYVRPSYRPAKVARRSLDPQSRRSQSLGTKVPVSKVLEEIPLLVFHGAAGTGKTTLVKRYAASLSERWLRRGRSPAFPIFLSARTFAARSGADFETRVVNELRANIEASGGLSPNVDVAERLLEHAPPFADSWLLIIDGIDEIGTDVLRESLIEAINHFLGRHRNVRIILTSRPLALFHKPFFEVFEHFFLLPFSAAQIQSFAAKWFAALKNLSSHPRIHARSEAKQFVRIIGRSGIRSLVDNPAVLTFAAAIYSLERREEKSTEEFLSNGRVELYERFVQLMSTAALHSRRTESAQQVLVNAIGDTELSRRFSNKLTVNRRHLLERAAFLSQENSEGEQLVDSLLKFAVENQWVEDLGPADELVEEVKKAIVSLLSATGLVVHNGHSLAFAHNTIREFLAASELSRRITPTEADAWTTVRRWGDPRWREIVLMLMAQWGNDRAKRAVLATMLVQIASSSDRGALFAGFAIAEGTRLEAQDQEAILKLVLSYAAQWNPCEQLFSEFVAPDPTDVLRALAYEPKFLQKVAAMVAEGGSGCTQAIGSFFDFAGEFFKPAILNQVCKTASSPAIAAKAYEALAATASRRAAVVSLRSLLSKTSHTDDKVLRGVFRALANVGYKDDLKVLAQNKRASIYVRLYAAVRYLKLSKDRNFRPTAISLATTVIQDYEENESPYDIDVLAQMIAEALPASKIMKASKDAEVRGEAILVLCKALVAGGHADAASALIESMAKDSRSFAIGVRLKSLRMLVELKDPEHYLRKVRGLAMSSDEIPHCQLEWASAMAEFGDFDGLELIAGNKAHDADRRCNAAERLAEIGEYVRSAKACRQIATDYPIGSKAWQRCGLALMAVGHVEEGKEMVPDPSHWCSALWTFIKLGCATEIVAIARCNDVSFDSRTQALRALKEICDRSGLASIAAEPCSTPLLNLYAYWTLAGMGLEHVALEGMHRLAEEYFRGPHSLNPLGFDIKSIYARLTIAFARHESASPSLLAPLIESHYRHDFSSDATFEMCRIVLEDERSRPKEIYIALKERFGGFDINKSSLDVSWRPGASVRDDTPIDLVVDLSINAAVLGAKEFAGEHLTKALPKLVRCASEKAGSTGPSKSASSSPVPASSEATGSRLVSSLAGAILWCFTVGRVTSAVDALLNLHKSILPNIISSNLLNEIVTSGETIANRDEIRRLIASRRVPVSIKAAGALALVDHDRKPLKDLAQTKVFRNWIDERKWADVALIEQVEKQLQLSNFGAVPANPN